MATGFVHDERYFWIELGPYLPLARYYQPWPAMDSPEGKRRILNLIRASGLTRKLIDIEPEEASEEQLLLFHSEEYVARVKSLSDANGGEVGDFAAICAGGYEFAKLAVGGCIAAVEAVLTGRLQNAFALVRPCGHHAERDRGRGFAIFSNVAIAILDARRRHQLGKVAVVDWDVHHGNGTQWAFYKDASVLTISIHQDRLWPTESGALDEIGEDEGRGFNINVPLPAGSGHGTYIQTMERVVIPALQTFAPELIVVASGFDANALDPLGRMMCTSETYRQMTSLLKRAAEEICGGRLVVCLEGGYSAVYVPFCVLPVLETLSEFRTPVVDQFLPWLSKLGGLEIQPHQKAVVDRAVQLLPSLRSRTPADVKSDRWHDLKHGNA